MPLAVAAFRRAHPEVALTLAEGEPEEIGPRVRAGEFDLALLFEFPGVQPRLERPGAGWRSVTLLEDPVDMIALLADVTGRYTSRGSVSPPAPPPPGPARRLDRPPPAAAAR